ncbi:hypothetical protein NI374_06660 [Vibrio parahaemolyticus]|nr:hypothetical protein NI374_06660 [Vibrio parahaemolyticus]
MDEKTNLLLDKAEELFSGTIDGDIEIIRDRLSYVTWLTALASAGIAFAMSQEAIINANDLPVIYGFDVKVVSFFCLFLTIVVGVFAKYQAHQSMRNNRILLEMAKRQRIPFYGKKMEENPATFLESTMVANTFQKSTKLTLTNVRKGHIASTRKSISCIYRHYFLLWDMLL